MMAIEGAIVTIDAMGCQRSIARKIIVLAAATAPAGRAKANENV
jgi:predicted transposase YbfD/YdcC